MKNGDPVLIDNETRGIIVGLTNFDNKYYYAVEIFENNISKGVKFVDKKRISIDLLKKFKLL